MGHVKHLSGTVYSLSDRLPRSMMERRLVQLPDRRRLKDGGATVKLVRDKLISNNKVVDPGFSKRPLKPHTEKHFVTALQTIKQSNEYVEQDSRFQAYAFNVGCESEVQTGLAAIRKIHPFATHHVYAYQYVDPITGENVRGHDDDGEWGASKHVAQQLETLAKNKLIVIVRYFGGIFLGKRRFEIHNNAAKTAVI